MSITRLSPQQVFDAALFGIRQQGCGSMQMLSGMTACYYRHPDGQRKCGIGFSIPDSIYLSHFDSQKDDTSIGYLMKSDSQLRELFADCETLMLTQIQAAHDAWLSDHVSASVKYTWEESMRMIALRFGLTYTPVGEEA